MPPGCRAHGAGCEFVPPSNASVFAFTPALSRAASCWRLALGPGYCGGGSTAVGCPAEVAYCAKGGTAVLRTPATQGDATVQLLHKVYHDCGIFEVRVGGKVVQTVDAFAPAPTRDWWAAVTLPADTEVTIVATGSKNASSSNSFVQLVGLQIKAKLPLPLTSMSDGDASSMSLKTDDDGPSHVATPPKPHIVLMIADGSSLKSPARVERTAEAEARACHTHGGCDAHRMHPRTAPRVISLRGRLGLADFGWANAGWHRLAKTPGSSSEEVRTPHMDGLVQQGLELNRAYQYKFCS